MNLEYKQYSKLIDKISNIYNKDYERIGYIESYSYLNWVRRYSSTGEFELKCAPENLPLLSLGNILAKERDREAGIIFNDIKISTL